MTDNELGRGGSCHQVMIDNESLVYPLQRHIAVVNHYVVSEFIFFSSLNNKFIGKTSTSTSHEVFPKEHLSMKND